MSSPAGEGVVPGGLHQLLHRLWGHGVAAEHLSPRRTVLAAEGDRPVEGEQSLHTPEHDRVPPGGQKELDPLGAQGVEGLQGGGGDGVGAEAHQSSVHVEENGLDHSRKHSFFPALSVSEREMLCKSGYHKLFSGASAGNFAAYGLLIAAPAKCGELPGLSVGAGHWPARILGGPVCRPYGDIRIPQAGGSGTRPYDIFGSLSLMV